MTEAVTAAIDQIPGHPPKPSARVHALDGLRAVAVCLVLAHHLGVATLAEQLVRTGHPALSRLLAGITASGVELFFVLSAVVLARPYVRNERAFKPSTYFFRRVERLYPPYLVAWLMAGAAIYVATRYPTWWTVGAALPTFDWRSWLAQLAIVYWGGTSFNFAWWSLTPELTFYLMLPMLIPWARRSRQHRALAVASLAATIVGASIAYLPSIDWAFAFPARPLAIYASCFAAGLLLAGGVPNVQFGFASLVFGTVWVLVASQSQWLNPHVGWGVLHLGLVTLAMHPATALSRALSRYPMVWLGERSYSIFLTHYTVMGLTSHAISLAVDAKSWTYLASSRLISLLLSLCVGVVLFEVVEKRFARNLVTAGAWLPWTHRTLAPHH